jgi:hypothetical protein
MALLTILTSSSLRAHGVGRRGDFAADTGAGLFTLRIRGKLTQGVAAVTTAAGLSAMLSDKL